MICVPILLAPINFNWILLIVTENPCAIFEEESRHRLFGCHAGQEQVQLFFFPVKGIK